MSMSGHFAYAQARLQARLAEIPDAAQAQQTLAARDLASLLASVRATAQRRYVARLAPGMDAHELERHLRWEWMALVDEVARWQPAAWFAAVSWLRWLPSLPLLQKVARGGRPPAWARADPVTRPRHCAAVGAARYRDQCGSVARTARGTGSGRWRRARRMGARTGAHRGRTIATLRLRSSASRATSQPVTRRCASRPPATARSSNGCWRSGCCAASVATRRRPRQLSHSWASRDWACWRCAAACCVAPSSSRGRHESALRHCVLV